jgi:ABC-type proline/glycine betaine transport system permease subunit
MPWQALTRLPIDITQCQNLCLSSVVIEAVVKVAVFGVIAPKGTSRGMVGVTARAGIAVHILCEGLVINGCCVWLLLVACVSGFSCYSLYNVCV